jgi:ketosteroid isomerase-like protein
MAEHADVTRHREGHEAFSRGDMAFLTEIIAEDTVWHFSGRSPVSGDHEGRDAVFAALGQWPELSGGTFQLADHDFVGNDEHTVAFGGMTASREGRTLDVKYVEVVHWRDGKIIEEWTMFDDQYAFDEFWS